MSDDTPFPPASDDAGGAPHQPAYTPVPNPVTQPVYGAPGGEWSAPDATYLTVPEPEKKKRTARTLVGAGVAAVVVLGAAGGAYAYSALASHGTQPETVVPATAVAFAKLDLDPAADQKIAVFQLTRKFPDLAKSFTDKNKVKDASLAKLFSEKPGGLNYDHDIKPWLGSRIAVAYVPDAANPAGADTVLVAGYTDEAKMKASLARYQATAAQKVGYTTRKGYVLISDTQAHADAVASADNAGTLSSTNTYRSDTRALRGNQIAVAWVDVAAVAKLAAKRLPTSSASSIGALTAMGGGGRIAMGIHADSSYVELSGATFGTAKTATVPAARSISALPADTAGALEISGLSGQQTKSWSKLPQAQQDEINRQFDGLGLHLPEDFSALLGSDITVSAGPRTGAGTTPVAAQVVTDGGARAVSILRTFIDGFNRYGRQSGAGQSGGGSLPVTVLATSKGYAIANDPTYVKSLQTPSSATLGSTSLFKDAVPHADGAQIVGFLNVGSLLNAPGVTDEDRRTLSHIGAVGLSATQNAGAGSFDLRVTIK